MGILHDGATRMTAHAGVSLPLAQALFAGASHGKSRGHSASDCLLLSWINGFAYLLFLPIKLLIYCHFNQKDYCYPWLLILFSYAISF